MPTVDRQQLQLYAAERTAFTGTELANALSTSECIGMVRTLFNRARSNGYWVGDYTPPIKFVADIDGGKFGGRATYWTDTREGSHIVLPHIGKIGWIVVHEVAHLLLMAGKPEHEFLEGHGKEFAAVYIWATSALFGIKWSNRLKRAFAEARIEAVCSLKED